jgi:2-hydroxycyclohexanecarboxyl-CoA dehydrogenase
MLLAANGLEREESDPMSHAARLDGKVAIVTGGGAGIGRAICLRLAEAGARVAVLDIRVETAEAVVRAIENAGGSALPVECDVTSVDQARAAVSTVTSALGSPDILVNNAGVDVVRPFVDTDEALWRRLIDINYVGFLAVTHATIPYFIEKKAGVMVNIGSDAGRIGNPGDAIYCGTKAAVMATSKALARELARYSVRVNCVAPGPILGTQLLGDFYEGDVGDKIAKMIPLRRLGTPEDVADAVLFFASDDSRYLTGQVLSVDGGLTMIG